MDHFSVPWATQFISAFSVAHLVLCAAYAGVRRFYYSADTRRRGAYEEIAGEVYGKDKDEEESSNGYESIASSSSSSRSSSIDVGNR